LPVEEEEEKQKSETNIGLGVKVSNGSTRQIVGVGGSRGSFYRRKKKNERASESVSVVIVSA
jgi:hypothetical protein